MPTSPNKCLATERQRHKSGNSGVRGISDEKGHVHTCIIQPRDLHAPQTEESLPALLPLAEESIEHAGHPLDGYIYTEVENAVPSPQGTESHVPYNNYIHREGRAILCMYNYSSEDRLAGTAEGQRWTDIMAGCCALVMEETGGDMGLLEAVWRMCIQNEDAIYAMRHIDMRTSPAERTNNGRWHDVYPDEDGFFFLLGTDNGKGVARMLADHPGQFGRKTIEKVRVFPHGDCGPCLC